MRNPVNVLKSLTEKSHDPEYKFERLYRNLYNPEFYLTAYKNIAQSQGSMTPGVDGKTLDNMSMGRIDRIIAAIKSHEYQPNPARREYIEKKNSTKKRPLGIPSTDDKLVQEIVRMILESIYEPTFSNQSHGFRPNRSCHTALSQLQNTFTATNWFIEGDIKSCFDSFDHHVLINILRRRIKDEYFIALMWKFLKAGYMEQWEYKTTYSGTPQGSGISPILANIYLNELDKYMEEYKAEFDVDNAVYLAKRKYAKKWDEMDKEERKLAARHIKELRKKTFKLKPFPVFDESFRKLQYIRYADDFIIGIIGSKQDAEKVKADIKEFLYQKLKLTMSDEKTKITNTEDMARFLGYDITVSHSQDIKYNTKGIPSRVYTGMVKLYVPHEKWVGKLHEYKAFKIETVDGKEKWKPVHRGSLTNKLDIDIISQYNAEIRGLYNFYRLASNASVIGKFAYIMEYSMYKTFGRKYEKSIRKIIRKYSRDGVFGVDYETKSGIKRCSFYNEGFEKQETPIKNYNDTLPQYTKYDRLNSLSARLKAKKCECCGQHTDDLRIHHVRTLKDLNGKTSVERLMMQKRRKSLALCPECFNNREIK